MFGLENFFDPYHKREYSAKSIQVSYLIFLSYQNFQEVLKNFPKDYVNNFNLN